MHQSLLLDAISLFLNYHSQVLTCYTQVLVRTGKARRVPKPHHKQIAETREKSLLKISHPLLNQPICAPSKAGNPSFINPTLKPRILHTIFVVRGGSLLHVNSFIPLTATWKLQPHPTQPDAVQDHLEKSCCSTHAPVLSNAWSIPSSSLFAGSKQPIILATMQHRQLCAGVIAGQKHLLSDVKDAGCPGGAVSHAFSAMFLHLQQKTKSEKGKEKEGLSSPGFETLWKINEAGANHPAARPRKARKKRVCF